ncbi:hypothetical protein [Spirosoma jeollabukense]
MESYIKPEDLKSQVDTNTDTTELSVSPDQLQSVGLILQRGQGAVKGSGRLSGIVTRPSSKKSQD